MGRKKKKKRKKKEKEIAKRNEEVKVAFRLGVYDASHRIPNPRRDLNGCQSFPVLGLVAREKSVPF